MRLKSYFADTIEAAMALAARELGEDALLVYSREASPEAKYLGTYEVVFAAGETVSVPGDPPSPAPAGSTVATLPADAGQSTASEQFGWATSALAELRNEIGCLRQDVASHRRCMEDLLTATDRRAWRLLADWGSEPELLPGVALAGRLLGSDMDAEHVLDVIECARDAVRLSGAGRTGESPGTDVWKQQLERELIERRPCDARLEVPGRTSAIVLIGPPGAGRTTVAMQLTAHATGKGLEPSLIAFEPARLTAAQALRSFAAVLGAPFELARRADHLISLLSGRQSNRLTIVDGPGLGPLSDDGAAQLTALCGQSRHVETWLVLPATLRSSDLRLLIERFAPYSPARLIFTRTGEARHWGAVWSAAEWAALPIGFFCDGPRIPEDLKIASGKGIAAQLLGAAAMAPPELKLRGGGRALAERAGGGAARR